MANKKINQLVLKTTIQSTDLFPLGDATTGQLYKKTIAELQAAIGGAVISVNGLVGTVVLDTDDIQELASPTNKYFTDARARAAISLTTSGSSGASTYSSSTGVLNVPTYTLAGLGGITASFLSGGTGITYNSGTGVISYSGTVYTDASVRALVSAGTGLSYNSTTGVFSYSGTVYTDSSVRALISGTAPITYNNTTGAIGITQATTSTNGYLSSTDWNTFNGKQGTITLTTTGTSGAATFSGGTLNIPQYQGVLTNPVTGTGTTNYVTKWTSSSAIGNSLIFDNGTNVGIGTATPQERFEVAGINGNIRIYGRTGVGENQIASNVYWNGSAWVRDNSSYGAVAIQLDSTNSRLIFSTTSATSGYPTERMRISSDGQIIAGDSSLAYTNAQGYVAGFKSATINQTFISIARSGQTLGSGGVNIGLDQTAAYFYVNDNLPTVFRNNAVETVRISASGNLGIGNNSPDTSYNAGSWFNNGGLVVGNITSTSGIQINSSPTSTLSAIRFGDGDGANNLYDQGFISYNHNLNKMSFGTNRSTALVIEDSGHLTINAAITDYSRFNIKQSTGAAYGGLNIYSSNGTQSFFGLGITGGVCSLVATYGSTGSYLPIQVQTGGQESLRITTTNNLLIGTTTDNGERLYVSGSIRATGSITANSDARLKKNIERIENALEKVGQISGYTYNTIYDENRHAGVIAQEIDLVLPEIVNKGNDGLMGVEYGNISALLIEAIKDLKKDNESLRAIVEGLSK